MAKDNKPKGKLIWKILCGVFAFLFAFLMIAGPIANNYATIINMVLGIEGSTIVGDAAEDLPPRFVSDFEDSAAQAAAADLVCESVVANGAVLLLNRNNALPLSGNEKVSLLGTSSARFVYGGTGSGGMDTSKAMTLKDALEQDGFTVNPTLWAFYREGAGKDYGQKSAAGSLNNYIFKNEEFAVNEAPPERLLRRGMGFRFPVRRRRHHGHRPCVRRGQGPARGGRVRRGRQHALHQCRGKGHPAQAG